jgi:copper(I)-binding protein
MRSSRAPHLVALILLVMLATIACSGGGSKPIVSDAWVRVPMGADRPAAGYLTIVGGDVADALIAASSPVSMDVQVHETTETADGMGMQEVDRIEIPAGATVQLEPGGYHIMIMMPDLDQVVVGESVEITLTFEGAGDIVVDAEVRAG